MSEDQKLTYELPAVRLLSHDPADIRKWSAFVDAMQEATIYHEIAWRDIFESTFAYKSRYLIAERADGSVCGVLPLLLVPSLFGRPRLVAVPFRDRGGVLADDPDVFLAIVRTAAELVVQEHAAFLEIKTVTPYADVLAQSAGLTRRDYWVRSIAKLADFDQQDPSQSLDQKRRNMVRQATKAGLTVERGAGESLNLWYEVYIRSQRALGIPPFPKRFFESMKAGLAGNCEFFKVQDRTGRVIAACIVFYWRDTAIYAYSASLPEHRHLRPNDLMLLTIVQKLIEMDFKFFDLGSDSPDQDGLLFYKKRWKTQQQQVPFYYLGDSNPASLDSSNPRFRMLRGIVRRTPLTFNRILLSGVVRYFG